MAVLRAVLTVTLLVAAVPVREAAASAEVCDAEGCVPKAHPAQAMLQAKTHAAHVTADSISEHQVGSKETAFVPFRTLLERAAEDPTHLRRVVAELGVDVSVDHDKLQKGLVLLVEQRRSASLLGVAGVGTTMSSMASKVKTDADFEGVLNDLASATGGAMATLILGNSISLDSLFSSALSFATDVVGMFNPVLGFVCTFLGGLIGGLLGGSKTNPMEEAMKKLYEKIMREMRTYVDEALLKQRAKELQYELTDLMEELAWVPAMLSAPGDHQQTSLSYYLMFQHQVATMKSRLFTTECIDVATSTEMNEGTIAHYYRDSTCRKWVESKVPMALGMLFADMHLQLLVTIRALEPLFAEGLKTRASQLTQQYRNLNYMNYAHVWNDECRYDLDSAKKFCKHAEELRVWLNNVRNWPIKEWVTKGSHYRLIISQGPAYNHHELWTCPKPFNHRWRR